MQHGKVHIIYRVFTLLTIVLLMMPIVVKSTFIFKEHHHEICTDDITDSHFHTKDLHCELFKFTPITHFITIENDNELFIKEGVNQTVNYYYYFLKNHRQLPFSLRGPPRLI